LSIRVKVQISFPGYVVYVCPECGMSFGVPDVPVTKASFDGYSWTKRWTSDFPKHVRSAERSLTGKIATIAKISANPVRSMLDIGCGNGAALAAAEHMGIDAEGMDIDVEHVRFAQSHGLRAFHADIGEHQPGMRYDLIHIKETLHLITDTRHFIQKVATLMDGNTVLYLDSTHGDGLASRYRKHIVRPPRYGQLYPPLHNRTFNRKSMTCLLESAGLRILRFVTFNKGNHTYCPTPYFNSRQYMINPLLDLFFLGGFIGCYARKEIPDQSGEKKTNATIR
jgi:2-polyprenyl-3-methyl-5-hydroxy-6-metoxy-1,4-benzoquinol methylase